MIKAMKVLLPNHIISLVAKLPASLVSLEAPLAFSKWKKIENFRWVGFLFRASFARNSQEKTPPPWGFSRRSTVVYPTFWKSRKPLLWWVGGWEKLCLLWVNWGPLGIDTVTLWMSFEPLVVNLRSMGDDFRFWESSWASGSRWWAFDNIFKASWSQYLSLHNFTDDLPWEFVKRVY